MLRILDQATPSSGRQPQATKDTPRGFRPNRWISLALIAMLVGAFGAVAAQEPTETTDPFAVDPAESEEATTDNETQNETIAEATEEATTPPVQEQSFQTSGCEKAGTNAQCNSFGSISMPSQREIKGEPVEIDATITIDSVFPERNARWVLFSLRNFTEEGASPVMIVMRSFSTEHGAIVTTRAEQKSASELNLWVDTLDLPIHTPITLSATVGASERGAYVLELLVMAFDRGYTTINDPSGAPQSLYSFTLLGVNKETKSMDVENNSLMDGKKVPALPFAAGVALLFLAAVVVRARRVP